MAQWVMHKSGVGEKWEVDSNLSASDEEWCVKTKRAMHYRHFIPKSEYIPCPAPEQWERVEVSLDSRSKNRTAVLLSPGLHLPPIAEIYCADGYRVRSLVVERRKP